jgi:O-antigen/teichoic acid export membrane protein
MQYVRRDAAKPCRVGSFAGEAQVSTPAPYRALLNSGLLVFASSMVLNIGGFVFHAIASRLLGVANYGALYALVSFAIVAAVPISIFTPVVMKYAAEFRALHDEGHMRGLIAVIIRMFGIVGAIYIVAGIVLAVPIGAFLHVPAWQIPLVGAMSAVFLISAALRGVGTGIQDFVGYAASMCSEGISKLAFLVAFAIAGLTVGLGFTAFLLGLAAGLVAMAIPLAVRYRSVRPLPIRLDYRRILATTGGAGSITLTVAIMGFADVVIVKHFFDVTSAGLYSAVSLGGKIMLYFVGFVPMVLIPQAAHRFARGERTRETLWAGLGFIAIASVVGIVAYRFFGLVLLHVLVGRAFDAAAPLLPGYAVAMALLALTQALSSYGIATHRLGFAPPLLIATLATLGAIAVEHPSLQAVIEELIAGNALMMVVVGVALARQARRPARTA